MRRPRRLHLAAAALVVAGLLTACGGGGGGPEAEPTAGASSPVPATSSPSSTPTPTAPAKVNVYEHTTPADMSPVVADQRHLVYVPNHTSGTVSVIDPTTYKVIDTFTSGGGSQHVVPSYDLKTLWVNNNEGGDSLTPIDPVTGKRRGPNIPVEDPYNMYFTPDGSAAIIVEEAKHLLTFRDPQTMALQQELPVDCDGVNHADYSADLSYALFTCEFDGKLIKVDVKNRKVLAYYDLRKNHPGAMPQDVRLDAAGDVFYVADMMSTGVYLIDASGPEIKEVGSIPTGPGPHGIYPSRDGTKFYVSNRGYQGKNGGTGVSVIDMATRKVVAQWPIPGGGSPDMGGVTADGKELWLSGRYDNVVYVFDTTTGQVTHTIPVGKEPHGLAVWPQPGRFSMGHTGNMR